MRRLVGGVAVVALAFMFAGPALAKPPGQNDRREAVTGGTTPTGIYAEGSFRGVIVDPPRSSGGRGMTAEVASWKPPACYFAPRWKASEFQAWWEGYAAPEADKTNDPTEASRIREHHEKKYGDYNIDKEDEGAWWTVHTNPDSPAEDRQACERSIFWVDHSDPPPPGPGVPDAAMLAELAELAYEHVDIPELSFEVSPAADAQKVNLATWVWLPESELDPVSATARLDGYANLSSTVTARPVSVSLDAGTADATVHAGSGGCAVSSAGVIGAEWTSARKGETPPCGVTYHRATHGGSGYELSATVTWEVSWEGSDGSGGDLPSGEFGSSQTVQVQEVQTIVR